MLTVHFALAQASDVRLGQDLNTDGPVLTFYTMMLSVEPVMAPDNRCTPPCAIAATYAGIKIINL
jgi:hypothetical protein